MNATDIVKYGQQTALQAIDGFPETAWETPGACGVWSVKDIIAHLASYEQVLIDILIPFTGGGPTPMLNSFIELGGQFNDLEVNRRKAKTIKEVWAEFNDTHTQVMPLMAKIPSGSGRLESTNDLAVLPVYARCAGGWSSWLSFHLETVESIARFPIKPSYAHCPLLNLMLFFSRRSPRLDVHAFFDKSIPFILPLFTPGTALQTACDRVARVPSAHRPALSVDRNARSTARAPSPGPL